MAGLLDGFGDFIKTPEGQGLLSAVMGGMAGARQGTPWNNVGRAGMAGVMGYGGALDRQAQASEAEQMKKYRQAQMDQQQFQMEEAKKKAAEAEQQRAWRTGLPAVMNQKVYGAGEEGPTMAQDTGALNNYLMLPNSPFADKVLEKKLFPKELETTVVGDSLLRVGPNGATPIYTAPPKPDGKPTKVQEYEYAVAKGYKGTFDQYVSISPTIMAGAVAPLRQAQIDNLEAKRDYELPAPRPAASPGAVVVQTPAGPITFKDQKSANSFKMKAGIK
jgi:hypothetical protein